MCDMTLRANLRGEKWGSGCAGKIGPYLSVCGLANQYGVFSYVFSPQEERNPRSLMRTMGENLLIVGCAEKRSRKVETFALDANSFFCWSRNNLANAAAIPQPSRYLQGSNEAVRAVVVISAI